jgi:leucyl-tRNA synthetase
MRDLGLVSFGEPFTNLLTQGMVVAETYYREDAGGKTQWFNPAEVTVEHDAKGRPVAARLAADDQPVRIGGIEKMSKSKNNGVDPQSLIDEFGADTARCYAMFASPPEQSLEWSDSSVEGVARFLRRLWAFACELDSAGPAPAGGAAPDPGLAAVRRELHANLRQANYDIGRHQLNTVVSAAMKMLNALERAPKAPADGRGQVLHEGMSMLLRLLAPITPHICHALWRDLGYGEDILDAPWPEVDERALIAEEQEIVVQVNGKLRGSIRVPHGAPRETVEKAALENPAVRKICDGKTPKKVVVVPGRLVNLVV